MSEKKANGDFIDLGSADEFDPFDFEGEPVSDTPTQNAAGGVTTSPTVDNPLETAVNNAENKDAAQAQQNLLEKLPVFEYAGAVETLDDAAKTFDELRIEKSADFPELEDGKRVSWTVEYGKITKPVSDPKSVTIGKMKADIETSKDFLDALKKSKDKSPVCKVKPRVTAQSKGVASAYKGVFTNMEDADLSGKIISVVPARDGKVYEIRNTEMGRFITPVKGCDMLSNIRAGFIRTLPLIPKETMLRIISFFRQNMSGGMEQEALVNIYYDKQNYSFIADVPEQTVSKVSVNSNENPSYADSRYIHYMDIHSHNSMRAFFSTIDNRDEKATRLYNVIGRLDKYYPDIKTRISNGGKFWPINTAEVFEGMNTVYPEDWNTKVHPVAPYDDDGVPPWEIEGDVA